MNSGKLGPTVTTNMVLEKRLKYASPTEEEIVRSVDSDTPTASEDQDARFMYDGSETPRDGKVSRLEQDAGRSQPPGARRVHDNTKKHGGLPNDPDCLMDATDGKPPQSGNATGKQTDTDILERDRGGAGGGGAPPPKIPIVMVTGVSTGKHRSMIYLRLIRHRPTSISKQRCSLPLSVTTILYYRGPWADRGGAGFGPPFWPTLIV